MAEDTTLCIDIIAGTQFGSLLKENSNSSVASSFFCVVRFNGKEIGRTEQSSDSHDPAWLTRISLPIEGSFDSKQLENNRPFFFEYLDVSVYDTAKSVTDRIGECRIPLVDIGTNKWYKIVKPLSNSGIDIESSARLQISIEISGEINTFFYSSDPRLLTLAEVFPPHLSKNRHLYMDLGTEWTPSHLLGSIMLPGPRLGEVITDMHGSVEWKVVSGSNCFGDKYYIQCMGFLIITDLRVIFLPQDIQSPVWSNDVNVKNSNERSLTAEELLSIRRMTYQIPISAIQDCSVANIDMNVATIVIESKDGFRAEFFVRRPPQGHRRPAVGTHNNRSQISQTPSASGSGIARRRDSRLSVQPAGRPTLLPVALNFFSGLETYCVAPYVWCNRAMDVILFMIREDRSWIKWAQYFKLTCDELQLNLGEREKDTGLGLGLGNKGLTTPTAVWLKKAKQRISEEDEYRRLRVQDGEWVISDINCSYQLCSTYPQTIVIPGSLAEEDVRIAAQERSRGRLCVLTWLHPISKVPLCRSAQPNAGMSGSNEGDKKACIAIKNSCPTGQPLRIADARPKLNANANSLQGKGFENVAFFGGPTVASINFLDIENIHVMRSSLIKLREGWYSSAANSTSTDSEYVQSSRWLYHISTLLRGAVGMAESIILGYPVLVHCSDGWDRTAQLSALTQILLDPFYRTVDGFFSLVSKDWCAFGHKFEYRCNKHTTFKESSPTFLQFLDAVWQIQQQFPASFEYTSQFLVVFAQACYSGYFTSFRGDSEDERNSMMRRVAPLEDMPLSEMQYSTVFCYIYMLLRSESFSSILINTFFQPPNASNSSNLYLRARTSIIDLSLWKEGLAGFNKHVFEVSLGPQFVNQAECVAIASNINSRFTGYLDMHKQHLDGSVRNRLDVIASSGPIPNRNLIPYYQSRLPANCTSRIQYRQLNDEEGTLTLAHFDSENDSSANEVIRNIAASRLQLWFRAFYQSKRATLKWQQPNCQHSGLRKTLFSIALSELKIIFSLKRAIASLKIKHIQDILDEVVEEALIRCMRFEAAQRCILNEAAQYQSPDKVDRRNGVDSGYFSPTTSSTTSYVTGGLKSMAAMAGGLKSMVSDSVTGGGSSSQVMRNSNSSDRLSTVNRESELGGSSPTTPSTSKKTLSKKLFTMMTGGMLEKEKQSKSKDTIRESIAEEASV